MSRPQTALTPDYHSLSFTAQMMKLLVAAPMPDALGVALAFVRYGVTQHPDVMRRLLNEPVIKHGFRGEALITELNRAAR